MTSDTAPDVGLVLACYNEAEHFRESVPQILAVFDSMRWSYEIIFVDDCSKDDTRRLIDEFIAAHPHHRLRRIFHEKNSGRGGAVSDGFRDSKASIVGFIDIDLETHARYIPSCIQAIEEGADVAIGWRIYKFYVHSLFRWVLSRGYHWLQHRLLPLPVNDSESGFKFFRREPLMKILDQVQDQGWFWDTEIVARAHAAGLRIAEIPTLFQRRDDKTSTVRPLRDSIVYFQRLIDFRRDLEERRR